MFNINDKVVCIDDKPKGNNSKILEKGVIYLVRGLSLSDSGELGILLFGIFTNCKHFNGNEAGWDPKRFRKIIPNAIESKLLKKMKSKNSKWIVHGWLNGDDYENNKPANYYVIVSAKDESKADQRGDKKITKLYDKCEIIISSRLNN